MGKRIKTLLAEYPGFVPASTDAVVVYDESTDTTKASLISDLPGGGGGGAVNSVNAQTGTVVLDADDIAAGATNRYVTSAEKTKLSNLSGVNTGDQNISGGVVTLYVVASNANILEKAKATHQCNGSSDDVEILAALATGLPIKLSRGDFYCDVPITLTGNDATNSPNIYFRGAGTESTVFHMAANTDGIVITEQAKVDTGDYQVQVSGTGIAVHSISATSGDRRAFWQSRISNINAIGDFGSGTGWAYSFENPFRSIIQNLLCVGFKNGMNIESTYSGFNPGNCTFINCFMELNIANGIGYQIHSANTGGNMNIMTFIECDTQDSATSTTSIGWNFLGSTTSYFRTKDINVISTNTESFNTTAKFVSAENISFHSNYTSIEGNGTVFDIGADCRAIDVSAGNLDIGGGQTVKILNDTNSIIESPTILRDCAGYNVGTMTITTTTATVLKDLRRNGGGTFPAEYIAASPRSPDVLMSPNGTLYRVAVSNAGVLSTVAV